MGYHSRWQWQYWGGQDLTVLIARNIGENFFENKNCLAKVCVKNSGEGVGENYRESMVDFFHFDSLNQISKSGAY
jgi:hypothetical protein